MDVVIQSIVIVLAVVVGFVLAIVAVKVFGDHAPDAGVTKSLQLIIKKETEQMSNLQEILDTIRSQSGKLDSIKVLIEQLRSLVDQGKVDEAFALLQDNSALMDAIVANPTPSP